MHIYKKTRCRCRSLAADETITLTKEHTKFKCVHGKLQTTKKAHNAGVINGSTRLLKILCRTHRKGASSCGNIWKLYNMLQSVKCRMNEISSIIVEEYANGWSITKSSFIVQNPPTLPFCHGISKNQYNIHMSMTRLP